MRRKEKSLNGLNDLQELDAPIHRWWRFVLAYPPHLVSSYLDRFDLVKGATVYDPFSGTGTTLVESKKRGFRAVGSEALEFCYVASKVKSNWEIAIKPLKTAVRRLSDEINEDFARYGLHAGYADHLQNDTEQLPLKISLPAAQSKLLGKDYISKRPLQKLLIIRKHINELEKGPIRDFSMLALGAVSVAASNVGFGPEIYARKPKADSDVWKLWSEQIEFMVEDLTAIEKKHHLPAEVFHADARSINFLKPSSVDAVITSPPYPNEKNYLRITRIEHVITNLIRDRTSMKIQKKMLLRSNSGNVYKGDDDGALVQKFLSVQKIANEIEERRIALEKDSGWEKLYPTVVRLYFGGMYKHLKSLHSALKPNAKCAYVIGDQMSFLMVHIKTGEILAEIAEDIGFKVEGIDLWRDRWATASKTLLREEVLLLTKKAGA